VKPPPVVQPAVRCACEIIKRHAMRGYALPSVSGDFLKSALIPKAAASKTHRRRSDPFRVTQTFSGSPAKRPGLLNKSAFWQERWLG
jgi:hypothetical protein